MNMRNTAIFDQISMNHKQLELMLKIRRKGRDEQERQYFLPSAFGNKALNRNAKGIFKMYERNQINSFTKLFCPR